MAKPPSILRTRDLEAEGLSRVAIRRLAHRGELLEVGRGLYTRPGAEPSLHHGLAVVAARAPEGVVCLLSALAFHEITTQAPSEVWLALPPRTWAPVMDWPTTRVVRFSGARLHDAVEHHAIEGIDVKVYGSSKTAVDCFRYRQQIGVDVALEALRETLRTRRATKAQLWELAVRQGAAKSFRQTLEAL
jgi:predicted transcriptional regulator of viral defense system